jgi:tripartite-type tricarboxylate transporter receptor subunit TctC
VPTAEQQTSDGLKAFIGSEIDRWSPIIKAAGVTIQ